MTTSGNKKKESYLLNIGYDEEKYEKTHLDLFREISKIIDEINPVNILDIGAATGLLYRHVNTENRKIFALDINKDFVDALNNRGIKAFYCNIEKDNFPNFNEKFDLMIMTGMIEHNLNPKYTFKQIYNNLSDKGRVLLSFPNANSIARRWGHLRGNNPHEPLIDNIFNQEYQKRCAIFYSVKDLSKQLRDSFEVEKVVYLSEDSHSGKFKKLIILVIKALSALHPPFREQIIVVLRKK